MFNTKPKLAMNNGAASTSQTAAIPRRFATGCRFVAVLNVMGHSLEVL